jgi:hypothetical protein
VSIAGYIASISLTVTGHQITIGASRWGPRLELHVSNIILSSRYRKVVQWLKKKLVEFSRGRGYITLSEEISNHVTMKVQYMYLVAQTRRLRHLAKLLGLHLLVLLV